MSTDLIPNDNDQKIRISSCVCEQFSIQLRGDPPRVSVCHCFACQKRTGSVFGTQVRYKDNQIISQTGQHSTYVRIGDEGNEITYKFCPNCGSTLSWKISCYPEDTIIAVGNLCDINIGSPTFSVYEARKHPWVKLPDNITNWD